MNVCSPGAPPNTGCFYDARCSPVNGNSFLLMKFIRLTCSLLSLVTRPIVANTDTFTWAKPTLFNRIANTK